MSRWRLDLPLDREAAQPLFVQIAEGLSAGMRTGRLPPGTRLPGSRALASELGVHRNTVLTAYAELRSEGWLEARDGAGTFVSGDLPKRPLPTGAPAPRDPQRVGFELGPPVAMAREWQRPGQLSFGSTPDTRFLPWKPLARAYRRALERSAARLLDYDDPRGQSALREALATMLAQVRGLTVSADDIMVTRGSQMALYLIAQALVRPGDVVAVETLGYRPAWSAFEAAGARLVPIPVDAQGLDVEALEARCGMGPIRALYLTPHHQYPTTVALSPARRLRLLALAKAHKLALIEDDYDNEFHYESRPLQPLAASDTGGVVVYAGTLSKVLAPGLRLGFIVAPRPIIQRCSALRMRVDRQGDGVQEKALAELFEDGEIQRHVRRMRGCYRRRRDVLAQALHTHLKGVVSFELPRGGMAIWTSVAPEVAVGPWVERALTRGVYLLSGQQFSFENRPLQHLRLGFAAMTEDELVEAIRRLSSATGKHPQSR